jgi:hypothetical protein
MSKLTRQGLKAIIKECLVEILSDGLGNTIQESVDKKSKVRRISEERQEISKMQQRKRTIADSISYATSDPVLQSVFQHTADTTLIEQNAKEMPTMMNQRVSYADDPTAGPGLNIDGIFNKNWSAMDFPSERTR